MPRKHKAKEILRIAKAKRQAALERGEFKYPSEARVSAKVTGYLVPGQGRRRLDRCHDRRLPRQAEDSVGSRGLGSPASSRNSSARCRRWRRASATPTWGRHPALLRFRRQLPRRPSASLAPRAGLREEGRRRRTRRTFRDRQTSPRGLRDRQSLCGRDHRRDESSPGTSLSRRPLGRNPCRGKTQAESTDPPKPG